MTVEMNLQRGLVGHWTMNSVDVDNSTIRDQSGSESHGQINGPVPHYPGKENQSCYWSGLGTSETIDITGSKVQNEFTLSAWIYFKSQNTTDNNDWRAVIRSESGSGLARMLIEDQGAVSFRAHTGSNFVTGTIPTNEWKFITCVYDGSDRIVYVDGGEAGRETINTSGDAEDFTIGGNSSHNPHGLIDDVRVYDRALSQAEINQLYNIRGDRAYGSPHVPQRPVAAGDLVAWYPFEGQASDVTAFQQWAADDTDYSGTVNGATHEENGGVTDIRHGSDSSAYDFNASNSENVELFNHSLSSHSLSCWFNTDTLSYNNGGSNALIFGYYDAGGAKYTIINMNGGNMNFRIDDGGDSYTKVAGSSINADQWYHAVLTYDSSTGDATGYLDGSSIGSNSYTADITFDTGPYYVGGNPVNGTDFDGTVDDVRIYNKSLSQAEIDQIYANTKP